MKPTYSIILFSISFIFFIGALKYYSTHQKDMAKVLFHTSKSTRLTNTYIKEVNKKSIRAYEYFKYDDADDFRSFYNKLRAIENTGKNLRKSIKNFNSELFNLENPFYTIDEDEIIEFNEFIFHFNHKENTKVIIQNNATQLHNTYLNLIKKVENTLNDTSLFNPTNSQYLQILKYENVATLDTFKHQMKALENVKTIEKYCLKFDLLQLQLQLSLFEQYYFIFENTIIDNFSKIKFEIRNAEINNQNYAFNIYSQDKSVVGKDYELQLFMTNYIINESIQMQVNGQPIPVKNGIGYYKSTKGKSFKVDVSLINRMTNERDIFSSTFKR